MNFEFTDEQLMLKKTIRRLTTEVLEPALEKQDKDQPLSKEFVHWLLKQIEPYGFLGSTISEEQGGAGLDIMTWGLMYEELPPTLLQYAGITPVTAKVIAELGTDYQKEKFLPGLLSGDKMACQGHTEPNVGSNPSEIQTTAYLDGDHWVINGTKMFITNGLNADYIVVVVSFDRGKSSKGTGMILIDREVTPVEAKPVRLMGFHDWDLAELYFDNVRVPKENLFIPEGEGLKKQMTMYTLMRSFLAIEANILAERAFAHALKYVKEREQFGKKIGQFQMIQEMLADMKTDIDASKLITYRSLDLLSKGKKCRLETSMAKQFATEMAIRVTSKAIQIHGAYGLSSEFPLERLYRNARILTIPEGTTQIQKLIMGRELTGFDAFR